MDPRFTFMDRQIIGLQDWFRTPRGRYMLDWERRQLDQVVADIFGFHAVQLGLPALDALAANRMPHRWLVSDGHDLAAAQAPTLSSPAHSTTTRDGWSSRSGHARTPVLTC